MIKINCSTELGTKLLILREICQPYSRAFYFFKHCRVFQHFFISEKAGRSEDKLTLHKSIYLKFTEKMVAHCRKANERATAKNIRKGLLIIYVSKSRNWTEYVGVQGKNTFVAP